MHFLELGLVRNHPIGNSQQFRAQRLVRSGIQYGGAPALFGGGKRGKCYRLFDLTLANYYRKVANGGNGSDGPVNVNFIIGTRNNYNPVLASQHKETRGENKENVCRYNRKSVQEMTCAASRG